MKRMFVFLAAASLFGADDFESYRQSIAAEYNDYYQKEMKAFKSFVQTADGIPDKVNPYQNISVIPPKTVQKTPVVKQDKPEVVVQKPKNTIPDGTPSDSQIKTVKLNLIDPKKLTKPESSPVTVTPSVVTVDSFKLAFFGATININKNSLAFTKNISGKTNIASIVAEVKNNDAELIAELKKARAEYSLNDWDTYILVQTLVNTIYAQNMQKQKTIHAIDLLRGLGYKAVLAEGEDKNTYILIASKQQIYSKSFFDKHGSRFYVFAIDAHPRANFNTPMYFYNSSEDEQGAPMDMVMHKDPKVGSNSKPVKLSWDFDSKQYQMNVKANHDLAALMDMYPQVDYEIYMLSRSGNTLIKEISANLTNEIKKNNFSQEKAMSFILRFAQKAFVYKTDFDAYGFERPFFVEQTILLPYSDCEDRATLLSALYREVLSLDSIGLRYPGHISLGVAYNGHGDYYNYGNRKYYVTDGAYFYTSPGVSQPSFKGVAAEFLKTK